jgi:formylglycine-generating enzyme required for sulfatase activity
VSETEVTQQLWQAVMGTNPSYFDGSTGGSPAKDTPAGETQNRRPVEKVNWYAAIAFCNKLSLADGRDIVYTVTGVSNWNSVTIPVADDANWNNATMNTAKNGYRLPTATEWMWAAMGAERIAQPNTTGYTKAFAGSTGSNSKGDFVWHRDNSNSRTHEVGKKVANELGLLDMSGNVREWCWDRHEETYPPGTLTDYKGSGASSYRMCLGGSWDNNGTSSYHSVSKLDDKVYSDMSVDDLGFRVVYGE